MIIDAHSHLPLERGQWSKFINGCKASNVGLSIASCLGAPSWIEVPSPDEVKKANDLAAEFAQYSKGFVKWLAYINPQLPACIDEIRRCVAMGAIGVKLWISLKAEDGSLDNCLPVLDYAGKAKLPVLIHSFNRRIPLFRGEVNTSEIASLAAMFPDTTIIEAHAGSNWHMGLKPIAPLKNVYVDVSGYYPQREMVKKIVAELGADRVLFGSDMFTRDIASQLSKVLFADISESDKELLLYKNAVKVFKLDQSTLTTAPAKAFKSLDSKCPVSTATDHFCFAGSWPFLEAGIALPQLHADLERFGRNAFVASADSIHSSNLAHANEQFLSQSAAYASTIMPLATVNPLAANWPWLTEFAIKNFKGAFVSPYFHDWSLDDPGSMQFFAFCAQKKFPVYINCGIGDNRFYPKGIDFRPVSIEEIRYFLQNAPENDYVFQGLVYTEIDAACRAPRLSSSRFEISRLTDFSTHLESIVKEFGTSRLVFGSEYPLRAMQSVSFSASRMMSAASSVHNIQSISESPRRISDSERV